MGDIDRAARLLRHALELHEHGREYSWQARYPVREALKILEAHKKEVGDADRRLPETAGHR